MSGKLQGEVIAKLLNNKGNLVIMVGELATQAAVLRFMVAFDNPDLKMTAHLRQAE